MSLLLVSLPFFFFDELYGLYLFSFSMSCTVFTLLVQEFATKTQIMGARITTQLKPIEFELTRGEVSASIAAQLEEQ